jgi:hypothetical protein
MSPRLLVLAVVPLFTAATAAAQAPGEMAPTAPPPPATSVMENRWAIGLGFGSLGLAPEGNPDAKTEFSIGQLSLRYRATRQLELEVAFAGGRQRLDNGQDGDLAVASGTLGARYRFMPESAWNWWLMAGLGGTTVARHDATKQERDAASHGHGVLGAGLERRFAHFALQVEARLIRVGDKQQTDAPPPPAVVMPGTTGGVAQPPMTTTTAGGPQSGGSLTIGASYYF